ncbi:MAG: Mrp/NBP35 family ATP-binding protein [Deltaproteobacteria bacterium]|nr:Mrp/NBP35 family ATP-binding protein [Deltaproteobacteria bacterium]
MITTLGDLDKSLNRRDADLWLARTGKKYLVMSGKGGVGKTSVCVNLALAKAAEGARVGVLDIDFHGPDVAGALFVDARVEADGRDRLVPVRARENLHVLTVQHLLSDPDEAVMWRGPRKIRAIEQFVADAAWPELDVFMVDSPPGTGDEALAAFRTIPGLEAILVTTGHSLSLADAAKAASFVAAAGGRLAGIVDSMCSLVCPRCGGETPLYPPGAVEEFAARRHVPVLARLPWDLEAQRLSEAVRKPMAEAAPGSLFARGIRELAYRLGAQSRQA